MTATEWIEEWLKEFPSDKALVENAREMGENGRGSQELSRRDLTQGAYSWPIKKYTTPFGVVYCVKEQ